VRRDGDDAYLVVAADKGTATFSDIANAISLEYGHWLGDAFASGGSAGYDHKGMGITARGAWECVKRHFRELGVDIQSQDFTCAGIGDMSGDVFGNGMLLSKHTRLVAAFDHRHIFLDPHPDAASSHRERQRLFKLPRSSWDDYARAAISRGGGVWPRSAKSIALSSEARALLDIEAATATPVEVMRAILRMRVDLLWNGGIGTYVKAHDESHAEVRDRANDAIRADGREIRARVIGEGGNLGCTQKGRVEYAQHAGGRINTDFIDNSAGVNTSDVEVNIKILLADVARGGKLTPAARNKLLASMTAEVADIVLHNNYLQSQSLSVLEQRAAERLTEYQSLIRTLERGGHLHRALEFLPGDDEAMKVVDEATHCGCKTNGRAIAMRADVSKEGEVRAMYARMFAEFGTIDVLVANAGLQKDSALEDMTLEQWNTVIGVNLTGQFLCCREAVREFKRRGVRPDVSCAAGKIIWRPSKTIASDSISNCLMYFSR
jgi:glutamate dehydrogenase